MSGHATYRARPARTQRAKWFWLGLLFIAITGGVAGSIYLWQANKVADLTNNVATLKSQAAAQTTKANDLNDQIVDLRTELTETKSQIKTPTVSSAPTDQTATVTAVVKNYKDNVGKGSATNVTIDGLSSNALAAHGTVTYRGQDGGGTWLTVYAANTWKVVSQSPAGICQDQITRYNLPVSWKSSTC